MFLNSIFATASPLTASALVASGGAIGALGRYHLGVAVTRVIGDEAARSFPWATLLVNILGCLAMGVLTGWFIRQGATDENIRLFLGVGILGGFTTFSTFGLEMLTLVQRGSIMAAFGYTSASVLAGLAAVFIGLLMAKGAA